MLGRSARSVRSHDSDYSRGSQCPNGTTAHPLALHWQKAATKRSTRRSCRHLPRLPSRCCGSPQRRTCGSNRWNGCRREGKINAQFTINKSFSRVRFMICHSEQSEESNLIESTEQMFHFVQHDTCCEVARTCFLCSRPGRLRGSHLWCEPAPGARSKTLIILGPRLLRRANITNPRS